MKIRYPGETTHEIPEIGAARFTGVSDMWLGQRVWNVHFLFEANGRSYAGEVFMERGQQRARVCDIELRTNGRRVRENALLSWRRHLAAKGEELISAERSKAYRERHQRERTVRQMVDSIVSADPSVALAEAYTTARALYADGARP